MSLTHSKTLVRVHNWWHGTRITREGSGHRVESANARMRNTRIEFYGNHGQVILGRDVRLFDCTIIVRGSSPRLTIGDETRLQGVRIVVEDRGSSLSIGASTTMTGAYLQVMEGGRIDIGADCMVGREVEVNNSDAHSLVDAESGTRINPARDVLIGDHVWIGSGAWISKGCQIGNHAMIAARSRVVGNVPANALVAGSPAVIKRTGISWDRQRLGVRS